MLALRPAVQPVGQRGVLLTGFEVALHLGEPSRLLQVLRALLVARAPHGERVRAPLGREAGDRVRPDGAARQLHARLDVTPSWCLALAVRADPRQTHVLHVRELLVGPLGAWSRLLEEAEPARLLGEIAHRR